jgi:hypothetical protein
MSFPLPFDIYQPSWQSYYHGYEYLDNDHSRDCYNECDGDYYLLDKEGETLPAKRFFGLWMKDMNEFMPDTGCRTETLEDLLGAHRDI